jgi:hypothetical protein
MEEQNLEIDLESVEALETQFAAILEKLDTAATPTPTPVKVTIEDVTPPPAIAETINVRYYDVYSLALKQQVTTEKGDVTVFFHFKSESDKKISLYFADLATNKDYIYSIENLVRIEVIYKNHHIPVSAQSNPEIFNQFLNRKLLIKTRNDEYISRGSTDRKKNVYVIKNEIENDYVRLTNNLLITPEITKAVVDIINNYKDPLDVVEADVKELLHLYFNDSFDVTRTSSTKLQVIIKIDELNITDGRLKEVIKDLFITFTIDDKFKLVGWLQGRRTTYSRRHYLAEYSHSHLQRCARRTWGDFCTGGSDTAMSESLADLQLDGGKNNFNKMLLVMLGYLGWESKSGGPYVSMENIDTNSTSITNNENAININRVSHSSINSFIYKLIKLTDLEFVKFKPNSSDCFMFNDNAARLIIGDLIKNRKIDSGFYNSDNINVILALQKTNGEEMPISLNQLRDMSSRSFTPDGIDSFKYKDIVYKEITIEEDADTIDINKVNVVMEKEAYEHFKFYFKKYLIKNYNEYSKCN